MRRSLLLLLGVFVIAQAGSADYEVTGITSNATSVTVTWRVPEDLAAREWGVAYRRSTESSAHMRLVPAPKTDGLIRRLAVGGLDPGTAYLLCVAYGRQDGTVAVEPRKCMGASTSPLFVRSVLTSVVGGASSSDPASLTVAWRLEAPALAERKGGGAYRHEWTVRIREAEGTSFADVPVYDVTTSEETDGQTYEFDVSELRADVLYEVCLVDVEHSLIEESGRSEAEKGEEPGRTSCAFARTGSPAQHRGAEIGVIAACCVGGAVLALAVIAWRRCLSRKKEEAEPMETTPPVVMEEVEEVEEEEERKRANPYQAAWHTVRLPSASQFRPRPEFRSFRTGYSYGDFLTTVTIYGSGYSEC